MANYSIGNIKDLTTIIIPHFLKYPLLTQKAADFILFKRVVEIMNEKGHLTEEGLQRIINLKVSKNLGLSELLQAEFNNINPVARPTINTTKIPDLN
jgi:hypothetical protein